MAYVSWGLRKDPSSCCLFTKHCKWISIFQSIYRSHWFRSNNLLFVFIVKGQSLTIDSFELLKVIGKGSFGKVMQVRKRDTQRIYALKTIRKAHIASRNEITHTLAERLVLARVNNPFIVPLKFSFQSEQKLYLVLAWVLWTESSPFVTKRLI